jgi:hypothetical protein
MDTHWHELRRQVSSDVYDLLKDKFEEKGKLGVLEKAVYGKKGGGVEKLTRMVEADLKKRKGGEEEEEEEEMPTRGARGEGQGQGQTTKIKPPGPLEIVSSAFHSLSPF